ncbi:DUF1217 domain-containing protein [Pseudovibrio sp. Tun.PSC04-5.I4]|uniref:DUF1217 domain-containing protein n=1 Tax=Pseudovibrio sp. Tun.PSC04-5.I4 TaxID=1798213 RepID=UPI00088D025B|nr:DUF1217 domain-containing protein [Pseudovibrio sp. Tun.PSC04-5.I4]SDQ92221.1 Protein of unknown function [Pseudovibrio sp. Tun.PSC04-5.I4]
MLDTALRYSMLSRDMEQTLERTANDPMNARETKYYLDNIRGIETIEQFLADDRIFNYAMKSMGMEDMSYAKGLMRKVLEEGVSEPDSYANSLVDPRYKEFAEIFDFESFGSATTSFAKTQGGITERYVQQTLEVQEGSENNGVRLALYFERKIPEIVSAFEILGDQALYEVVRTVIGMPDELVGTDIDRQAAYIESRLKIENLREPEKLDKFIEKFVNLYDVINGISISPSVQLFGPAGFGIDPNTLAQMNAIKFGG